MIDIKDIFRFVTIACVLVYIIGAAFVVAGIFTMSGILILIGALILITIVSYS